MEGFKVCYTAAVQLEKKLHELLLEDNPQLEKIIPSKLIPAEIIEDLKCKLVLVLNREQKEAFLS